MTGGAATSPADDVREALADVLHQLRHPCNEPPVDFDYERADIVMTDPRIEVRPRGTVTDAEVEAAARALYEFRDGEFEWDSLAPTFRASCLPEARAVLEAFRLS